MSVIEWLAAILSLAGVVLTARRVMLCWPASLAASMLYTWIFWHSRLYADMALQILFGVFIVYGWVFWLGAPVLRVARPTLGAIASGCAAGLAGGLLWGAVLARWTDDPAPFADAALSAGSLVSQYWMARRYRVCWLAWMAIDAAYVALFISRSLDVTAVLYGLFVVFAFDGWRRWKPEQGAPSGAH